MRNDKMSEIVFIDAVGLVATKIQNHNQINTKREMESVIY